MVSYTVAYYIGYIGTGMFLAIVIYMFLKKAISILSKKKKLIEIAPIWKRILAIIVDIVIVYILIMLFVILIMYIGFLIERYNLTEITNPNHPNLLLLIYFSYILIPWLYFSILDSSSKQGTVGKQVLKIKITNYDGCQITFKQASFRFFSYFIYIAPLLIVSIFGKSQGFHNHLSKSKIINKNFIINNSKSNKNNISKIRVTKLQNIKWSNNLSHSSILFNKNYINIDNIIERRLRIYKYINIFVFFLNPLLYFITFLLQPKWMRYITSLKIFHKYYPKKYSQYLLLKKSNKTKLFNFFISRNLFLGIFFLIIAIILFLLIIVFVLTGTQGISIIFILTFYTTYRLSKVYLSPDAKSVIKNDNRKPIVLLHSYDDSNLSINSYPMLLGIRREKRLEEAISSTLNKFGPFISIENPSLFIPNLGSMKTYEKDTGWKEKIIKWMQDSQAIVCIINDTPSLEWELKTVIENGFLKKLIIIFPDNKTLNYQDRINFIKNIFRAYLIDIQLFDKDIKLLFFDSYLNPISIVSSNFNQEDYEEAIHIVFYNKKYKLNL